MWVQTPGERVISSGFNPPIAVALSALTRALSESRSSVAEANKTPRLSKHGSVRRYKQGCACELCTQANTDARRRERERAAARSGKPVPTARKGVPTSGAVGPTSRRPEASGDDLTRIIEEAIWQEGGTPTAANLAAQLLRDAGFRFVSDAPIEAAARRALPTMGGDGDLAALRRETAYRAAAVMDNPKFAPFFKSAAEVLRVTVEDLNAATPERGGEADDLKQLLDSLGSRGRSRGRAPVDDSEAPV